MTNLTAAAFIAALQPLRDAEEARKYLRYFKTGPGDYAEGDRFMGVRMGQVFDLAKRFIDMPADEIENLLDGDFHEIKAGGMSIMDKQARRNKTAEAQRKILYDLYLRRHDAINNWDLVDVAAPFVIGRYLADKPRDILYHLAGSDSLWERRTAIVATQYFLRQKQVDDAFALAERLLHDPHDLIHKAVGGVLRWAGQFDGPRLEQFLEIHAAVMPRTVLRYAIEHFPPQMRSRYMAMKSA